MLIKRFLKLLKYSLRDLFDKTNFNDVKEPDYPIFEGLFKSIITRPFLLDTNDFICKDCNNVKKNKV